MKRPRRLRPLAALAALLLALLPALGLAHPLGNFTVNRYSRVEVGAAAIRVLHVLDHAEIPSVQERLAADRDGDGAVDDGETQAYLDRKADDVRRGLELAVDGHPVPLALESSALVVEAGQGGLPLYRVELWLRAGVPAAGATERSATLRDRNEPARLGWREMVVRSAGDAEVLRASVPDTGISDELRRYPDDLLQSPLDQRQATWSFAAGGGAQSPAAPLAAIARAAAAGNATRPTDDLGALVAAADLNPLFLLFAVAASALFGAIHAASPGHGKTLMAAYLVGTRGTFRHALALAASVTVSHTAGVLALGAVAVFAANILYPEQLYPYLTLASGLLALLVGLTLLGRAAWGGARSHDHDHGHTHEHGHHHHGAGHAHAHHHGPTDERPLAWRGLVALGLAGGLVPSPSALVVLLGAVAFGRLGFGLLLVVAFGLGMAVVLTGTGFLLVYAGRYVARFFPDDASPRRLRLARAVPVLSATVMSLVGAATTYQAFIQVWAGI